MNRKFLPKRSTLVCCIAALFVSGAILTPSSQAQTYYWDVNGTAAGFSTVVGTWGTNLWNTDATGGAAGSTTAATTNAFDLIIGVATTNTGAITVSGAQVANSITFGGTVGAVTISGGTSITLGNGTAGAGGITLLSGTAAQTISTNLVLNNNQTWTNNSANALTVGGTLTGAFALTKAGNGTIILTNNTASTHTTTTITGGTLAYRPTATGGSYAFGSGLITLNSGTFAFNGNTSNTFTLTNNFSIGASGGTLDFGRASANNPNHDFIGTFDLSGNLTLSSGGGGGGSFQGRISGTTTLNGGNRTITVANGGNVPTIIAGAITQDASPRLLTIDSTSANSQVLQISGNNTGLTGGINITRTAGSQRVRFDSANSLGGGAAGSVAWTDTATVVGLNFAAVTADLQKLNPGASAVVGVEGNFNLDLGVSNPYSWTNKDTVRVGAIGNTTYTGTITPGSTGYRFATSAGSTLTLSGANKLTGTNDVNIATANGTTGAIAVNNNNDLVGTITVQSNAILRVSGAATTPFGAATNQLNMTATTSQLNLTGGNITIPNQITGSGSLSVSSANTFTLTNANTYTGGTTISAGTLALSGGNDRLSSTGTVNFTGTSALDIGSTNQTLAAITVANLANASITISGSGMLTINGASNFEYGSGGAIPNSTTYTYSLNMSTLGNFTYNAAANVFRVGLKSGATNGSTGPSLANSTVVLGNTNSITAATLAVGDVTASNNGGTQILRLGTNNTLNVGAVNIGFSGRSNATLNFNTGLTNPSVTLRGITGGTTPVATFNVGAVAQFTGAGSTTFTDTVDFSAGTVDALITSSVIGQADAGSSATRAGTVNASVTMGVGSFSVGTLTIGRLAGTSAGSIGADYTANGTFTLNNAAGTLNATTINLAESTIQLPGTFNRTVTGTLALTNGTVKATTIQLGTQGGINGGATLTVTPRINWTTGTIQNTDNADLTITGVPITLLTSATHTFNASGTQSIIQASTSPISGATFGITKTGPGSLVLNATNTYTGSTTVSAGTLRVNGSIASAVSVIAGTLDGTGNGTSTGLISAAVVIGDNSVGPKDAILAPGNSVGTLTSTSSLTFNSDAIFALEVDSSANLGMGAFDKMVANGVTIDPAATISLADIALTPSALSLGTSFTVIDNTSPSGSIVNTFANLANLGTISDGTNFYQANYAGGTGNDLVLTVVAIPEPSTLVLGGLAMLGLAGAGLRRRRMAKQG